MARFAVLSLALLAGLPACKDTPSYRLRWSLEGRPDPAHPDDDPIVFDVTRAFHCSQLGVNAVRVQARNELGLLVNEDVYPCFVEGFDDIDEQAEGPQLREGLYALEVRGVQRDLKEWIDPTPDDELPDGTCVPGAKPLGCSRDALVCDCQEFEAVKDETFSEFETFVLRAPEDCVDGIDNDVDGLVDRQDPGCNARESAAGDCIDGVDNDGDGAVDDADSGCIVSEASDVSVVQFTLRVTLLDENPVATCGGAGVTHLDITATQAGSDPFTVATVECRVGDTIFFSAELPDAGAPLTIEVQGFDDDDQPVTAKLASAEPVVPGSDAIIDLEFDFGVDDFTPPIVAEASFLLDMSEYPEPDADLACTPGAPPTLAIPQLSLQLLDLAGAPVEGATLRQGEPLDGTPIPCQPNTWNTGELTWGGYRLAAEALASDGTVCFRTASEGELLAPRAAFTIVLEPVLVAGALPAACFDCSVVDGCP